MLTDTIEVIIKIPKNRYETLVELNDRIKNGESIYKLGMYEKAIAEGTIRSKGHWIQQPRYEGDDQPDLVCPNCGFKIGWWDLGNFCARCGKELEGGADK